MASSRNETQITWSSASSVTVSSATVVWSDAFTFNIEDWEAELQINVAYSGTATSGDYCDVFVAYTTGDILGDTGSDYSTPEHAEFVARLDTYATNTPGENPANKTTPLRTAPLGLKVGVSCPAAATHNLVIHARIVTHRPQ